MADVAFEAYGKDLNELFENSALATMEVMVKINTVAGRIKKKILLEDSNVGSLLYRFIEEIIFLKDSDSLVFSRFDVDIKKNKSYKLDSTAYGEEIDIKRHSLGVDVKAITMHKFQVDKTKDRWKATIILDV